MRRFTALILTAMFLTGCADPGSDPQVSDDPSGVPTQDAEDTLPVLGAWKTGPVDGSDGPVTLTLSDDNSYVISDACVEMPGRWELEGGRVLLTPAEDGIVRCEPDADLPDLPRDLMVDQDQLIPEGDGPTFTR